MQQIRTQALDSIIDVEVLRQEANRRKLKATDTEVDEGYKAEAFRVGGEKQLTAILSKSGMTKDMLNEKIATLIIIGKLYDLVVKELGPISEKEAREYYKNNPKLFEIPPSVHAYQILIKVGKNAPEAEVEKARKEIEGILKMARKGDADFQYLAKKYSQGPTGGKGGDLGSIKKGTLTPEFDEALFSAAIGKIVGPLRSNTGFILLRWP